MASSRSNNSKGDQRSTDSSCPAAWVLVLLVGLLFQSPPVAAQTSPATLPNLKLSTATPFMFDAAVQDDGKVIISGSFVSVNGVPRTNLARLNPNGSVDLTWNPKLEITGSIASIVPSGTNIYLGGYFSVLDDAPRYSLVRVSALDGSTDKNWGPRYIDGNVSTIGVIGGDVYIAGTFTRIDGLVRSNLAKLSATGSGAIDPSWNPNANHYVDKLVVSGSDVFVAGGFTEVGGQSRNKLAKLSADGTGEADPAWDAKVIEEVTNQHWTLVLGGTNLYVTGSFTNIGGLTRRGLAKLSALGSGSADPNWSPTGIGGGAGLALANDALFVATAFVSPDGFVSSVGIAKLATNGTGTRDTNWNPTLDVPSLIFPAPSVLRVTTSSLFAAGWFHLCNGDVSLSLAKVDVLTGMCDPDFNAQVQSPGSVYAIARQPDGKLIIGGDFWFAGGLPRHNLARVNQDGSLDPTWAPNVEGPVGAIAVSGTNAFIAGAFHKVGGLNRTNLAKIATQGSDATDPAWDARLDIDGLVFALEVSGTNLFVAGSFYSAGGEPRVSLAKLDTMGRGDAAPDWQADTDPLGYVYSLALSGSDLFVGGVFTQINAANRTNVAKLSVDGSVDTDWDASIVTSIEEISDVWAVTIIGTNLFVGGYFTNIGGLTRNGLAKLSALGTGLVDPSWNRPGTNSVAGFFSTLAVGNGTNLYAGGLFDSGTNLTIRLARISTENGAMDAFFQPGPNDEIDALLATGDDLYVGGRFSQIAGASRYSFAFLPNAGAPQLIQDTQTSLFITRNEADGPEVTHFQITGVSGGTLYRSGGVIPVNAGDFLTIAEGGAGLKLVPGGTVTAVSALNNTPAGAGTATNSLTMVTNPSPVFKFSAAAYWVREGQGNIVVPVRKFGVGTGTVNFATSDLTATSGQDYQTRSGTLNFSATDRFQNLIITIADDLQLEGDERFAVTLTNVSAGASIAGPATAIVTIVDNDIVGVSDSLRTPVSPTSPPLSTGVLAVSLQPTNAHGQWRLLGELNWHDSGASVSGLVTGNYAVEFRPVNGYFQPQTVTVPISVGATNTFPFFYAATTNLETGKLSMFIQPDDVATATNATQRGQWRRQGGPTNWLDAGDLVPNLNAGNYTVEFKPVAGRSTPLPQIVQVGGAEAIYSGVGTYLFASTLAAQTPTVVPFGTATSSRPYLYNGQIQTSVGFGSGFVVKPRVVLTAAHVLFDDVQLIYVTGARWFFQRYRDQLEPVPQVPRGWYVFEGYASQRQSDNSPGLSTPASQNLDAAALYFLEDAGRGGYGGYLSSDADNNEYILGANNKFLVGYPLEGVALAEQGKLFATMPENLSFTRLYTGIFATTNIQSFPGNSGGPLYVQADVDEYLPAAICLGGSGETLVRAINSEIVDLINRAEISGNGGGNIVGGGVTLLSPGITAPPFGTGLLTISLAPTNGLSYGFGWRIAGYTDTNYVTEAVATAALIGGGSYPIEFKSVPGFITPSNRTVLIAVGGVVTLQADYVPIRPLLSFDYTNGLSLSGATGATYRVEFATDLAMSTAWTPLTNLTLFDSPSTILNTRPTADGSGFYRAVLVP